MVPRMLQLRCAGYGPNVSAVDSRKAVAVMIGGTLVLVVALTWAIVRYGTNPYLESFLSVSWLVPTLVSQRYTSLKGRRAACRQCSSPPRGDRDCNRSGGRLDQHSDLIVRADATMAGGLQLLCPLRT